MKKVCSDISDVAHLFANQIQEEATNSTRHFYFERNVIYSYGRHFPIAKHIEFDGKRAILFTTRSYNNTTAKHIGVVKSACRHKNIIYCFNPTESHDVNLNDFKNRIEQEAVHLVKARKPEIYINKINSIIAEAKKYIEFFNLEIPPLLTQAFSITDTDKYQKYIKEKTHILLQEEAERQKKQALLHKKNLAEWLEGKSSRLYSHGKQDYLRIYNKEIQTSQGVKLSIPAGRELYKRVKEDTILVGDKILYYTVNKTDKEYKIGCHTFPRKYLLEWGTKNL